MLWLLRHVKANGKRRDGLRDGAMGARANGMRQALGAQKAFLDRQLISHSGDGGLSMPLGDLLTAIQERILIKIATTQ